MTTKLTDEQIAELERLNLFEPKSGDNECVRCRATYSLRAGAEASSVCDLCAQEIVADALPSLLAEVRASRSSGSDEGLRRAVEAYLKARDEWFAWLNDKSQPADDNVTDRLGDAVDDARKAMRRALSSGSPAPEAPWKAAHEVYCHHTCPADGPHEALCIDMQAALRRGAPAPEDGESVREALAAVVNEVDALAAESNGVAGLHLNGDLATWDWLYEEWLPSLAKARALSAPVSVPGDAKGRGTGEAPERGDGEGRP